MPIGSGKKVFSYLLNFIAVGSGFVIAEGWKGLPTALLWSIPFIILNVWRAEIGAIWAILVMIGSYIHLFKRIQKHGQSVDEAAVENDSQGKAKMQALINLAAHPLIIQSSFFRDDRDILPERAKNNWSIGYVGGFADSVLQGAEVPMDGGAFAVMTLVFMQVYGDKEGPLFFRKMMDLQKSKDTDLYQGMQVGGTEFMEWFVDNDKIPMGWATYVGGV